MPYPEVMSTLRAIVADKNGEKDNADIAQQIGFNFPLMSDRHVEWAERRLEAEMISVPETEIFDYQTEAHRTLSDKWHGEKVPYTLMLAALADAIDALDALDKIKKTIFYGKDLPAYMQTPSSRFVSCEMMPGILNVSSQKAERIIHAIIGKATEAGELLEALHTALSTNVPFDEVNAKEELGDGQWYDAILAEALGTSIDVEQRRNIAKLKARFPDKFTEDKAQNRDLFNERTVLETRVKFKVKIS